MVDQIYSLFTPTEVAFFISLFANMSFILCWIDNKIEQKKRRKRKYGQIR